MIYSVLAVWTWALFQFPFVVTSTKVDPIHTELDDEPLDPEMKNNRKEAKCYHCVRAVLETEVWGICVSVFMQDGPFLALRLIAIFMYNVVTYTNYFFTAKNGLVLALQLYRVISLCIEHRAEKAKKRAQQRKIIKMWKGNSNA